MCGLVGIVGKIDTTGERMFKDLLKLDTMRGSDSTGVLSVKLDYKHELVKSLGTPWDLAGLKRYDSLFHGYSKLLLGHNRAATRGKISVANAHPFEFNTIIGAHNGTLRSYNDFDDHTRFDVDSEALFHHMDRNGSGDAIEKIDGAFALSWYDKLERTLNLARNHERPLFWCTYDDGKSLAWASEQWMLYVASSMHSIKLDKDPEMLPIGKHLCVELPSLTTFNLNQYKKLEYEMSDLVLRKDKPYSGGKTYFPKTRPSTYQQQNVVPMRHSEEDFLVTFEVEGFGENITKQKFIKAKITKSFDKKELKTLAIRIFPVYGSEQWDDLMSSPHFFSGMVARYNTDHGGYYVVRLSTIKEVKQEVERRILGYNDEVISEKIFWDRVKDGCFNCGSVADINDEQITWVAKDSFICGECSEEFSKYGGCI